jgi:hypothetical protein
MTSTRTAHLTGQDWLTLAQAAELAGCHPETVRLWCVNLAIGVTRDGKWQVNPALLDQVINARATLKRGAA